MVVCLTGNITEKNSLELFTKAEKSLISLGHLVLNTNSLPTKPSEVNLFLTAAKLQLSRDSATSKLASKIFYTSFHTTIFSKIEEVKTDYGFINDKVILRIIHETKVSLCDAVYVITDNNFDEHAILDMHLGSRFRKNIIKLPELLSKEMI